MKLLCVVAVLLLCVGCAYADKASDGLEPASGEPGSEYLRWFEYSVTQEKIIINLVEATSDGLVFYSNTAEFLRLGDDPKPAIGVKFFSTESASPISALATLQDGSTVPVTPAADGSVSHFFGDVLPGQMIRLAATMLVL